jgi:hypothetical protein
MTTERDFDRITTAWLAEGPEELPDRVIDAAVDQIHLIRQRRAVRPPWRLPTMTMLARVAALVAVGAVFLAGIAVVGIGGARTGPAPTQAPAASPAGVVPSMSTRGAPVLDTLFTSPRNGYAVWYPSSWTVRPATQSWHRGRDIRWGDPALDAIQTGDARFIAAGQKLPAGETALQWLKAYCLGGATDIGQCDAVPPSWELVKNAALRYTPDALDSRTGSDAYVDLNGVPAWPGTIASGGKIFDAVVVRDGVGWAFTLDGDVDRQMFDAFLDKVDLLPASLITMPELTGTFTSPTNGFSVGIASDWAPTTATERWRGLSNPSSAMDGIDITGTDSSVGVASQPLRTQTFDEYLAAYHTDSVARVPEGCDGGDPSTWPAIQIGDKVGRLQMQCNAADAFVEAGGRIYIFELGNATFETLDHFSMEAWKELLKSVVLDPKSAR